MTMLYLLAGSFVVALIVAVMWTRLGRVRRRDLVLHELLDGADALEAQLHEYRDRMVTLKKLLAQLPSDMTAPAMAMASVNPDAQVKTALRDILAHRLWIKREGATATIEALDNACVAIRKTREQLEQQLRQLDEVGSQLENAGRELRSAYQELQAKARAQGQDSGG